MVREKLEKITVDIRTKLKVVRESLEAQIDEYLRDAEAIPYEKHTLIINALRTFYLPLVRQYQGASQEKLRQSLVDANRSWQLHLQFLQERLGIDMTEETAPPAPTTPTPTSIPVPIAFPMNYSSQQYIEAQSQRKPETEINSQDESEQEGDYTHLFD